MPRRRSGGTPETAVVFFPFVASPRWPLLSFSTATMSSELSPLSRSPSSTLPLSSLHNHQNSNGYRELRRHCLSSRHKLEVTMSTPGVLEVVHQLVQEYPSAAIGAGTVLTAKNARNAVNAGAKFLMSPAIVKDILDDVRVSEYLYIPGAMTPTEILSAYSSGAKIVKVYPTSVLGGIHYIATIKKPFSHIPLVASQGITIDLIDEYIAQGASSVVLSDAIFDKEAMALRNYDKIYKLAQLAALRGSCAVERKRRLYLEFVGQRSSRN